MSIQYLKYTSTEFTLNKEWPNIKGQGNLLFRKFKLPVKVHNGKPDNKSLKFTLLNIGQSLFFNTPYDIFFVLTICNENPENSFHTIQKIEKSEEYSTFSSTQDVLVPFDCSKITPESGFISNGKITIKFYMYMSVADEEDENEPDEDYNPGAYISEKCWKIKNISNINSFKSSDFSFDKCQFHFEINKSNEDDPFGFDFICDKAEELDSDIKFTFSALNLGGQPTLINKMTVKSVKANDKIEVKFDKTFKEIASEDNGFNIKNVFYISIVSKVVKNKSTEISDYTIEPANNSKEETGYVGLVNQGATCYMNSMLQSLYHLPAFRKLVYKLPNFDDKTPAKKNIPLNLQRLFGQMQLSSSPCSTKNLTVSFGWNSTRTFTQHDTQEFCRVLLDNLENKLKGIPELEDGIAKIFRGQTKSFIRCTNVDFESSRVENFYDLTLTVEGCRNLEESFSKYVEAEKMDGDNQYDTGDPKYGKQDALMGDEFVELPPVLQIHLRRFKYDYYTDRMVKINDRFEFPEEIDLNRFVAKSDENQKSNVYDLYGILVHSGTVSAGHYYAFLRTSTDPQWYQFNDSFVSKATKEAAIDNNFGGSSAPGGSSSYSYYEKSFSAYVLIYVRRDDADWIFKPVSDDEIPEQVAKYVENPAEFEKEEKQEEDSKKDVAVTVFDEDSIEENLLSGGTGFFRKELGKTIVFGTNETRENVYQKVAQKFNIPDQIRLWTIMSGAPCFFFYRDSDKASFGQYTKSLLLQRIPEGEKPEIGFSNMIIFIKFFSPSLEPPLHYIGSVIVDESSATLRDLSIRVNEILGLPNSTLLDVYKEEDEGRKATLLMFVSGLETKLKDAGIKNCASIICQISKKQPSEENEESLVEPVELPVPKYAFKQRKEEEADQKKEEVGQKDSQKDAEGVPTFSMQKSKESIAEYLNTSCSQSVKIALFDYFFLSEPICFLQVPISLRTDCLKQFISDSLNLSYQQDSDSLLLYKRYYGQDYPSTSELSNTLYKTVKNIFELDKGSINVLFFKFFKGVSKDDLKNKHLVSVAFSEDATSVCKKSTVVLAKNSKYEDLVAAISKDLNRELEPNKFRIYPLTYEKVGSDINPKIPLSIYLSFVRVDLIPDDYSCIGDDERVVRFLTADCSSYGNSILTGVVFYLKVNVADTIGGIKEKIQKICKYDDEKMSKTHLFVGKEKVKVNPKAALNDDYKFDLIKQDENIFIIPQAKKKYKSVRKEEALKIDN